MDKNEIEQFPKSVKRFSDKNCGENKQLEQISDSIESHSALKPVWVESPFIVTNILKRDIFSETRIGYFENAPDVRVVHRRVSAAPWWSRPLAWILARREIKGLQAARGVQAVPQLIHVDADGLYRSWSEGTPLHLARPDNQEFYLEAYRILRALRRCGLTHNDLAKPQNWLMTPQGVPALIDFQLASYHKRRGLLFRYFAYEDFRHLIKQKRSFARHLMTPTEWRIVEHRSWPSRLWLKSGKKLYNFFTRILFNWSDGEGTGDRVQIQGPAIRSLLLAHPDVRDMALSSYSRAGHTAGLYLFVETDKLDEEAIRTLLNGQKIEAVQPVRGLPRTAEGQIRDDILRLIAINELSELAALCQREPQLADLVEEIAQGRRNFTDRRLYQFERDLSKPAGD